MCWRLRAEQTEVCVGSCSEYEAPLLAFDVKFLCQPVNGVKIARGGDAANRARLVWSSAKQISRYFLRRGELGRAGEAEKRKRGKGLRKTELYLSLITWPLSQRQANL
ncbi:hypothetical protein E2C01_093957 [Portunus trituberculatus]|uniref:Uncharacterized protein n=1 Tax=Portunus trituberculatus TaxID=210409 RepID=A0A5B7JVX7_PORTR|nr:hypothetical protein [Portunus trituberculatus]